jgi:hypothetical protein
MDKNEATRLATILAGQLDRNTVYRIAAEFGQPAFAIAYWQRQDDNDRRSRNTTQPPRAPARYRWHQLGT